MRKLKVSSWKLEEFKMFLLFSILLISNSTFGQYKIPEKPSLQTSVYDYGNVLSDTEEKQLGDKLVYYSDSTSTQIVVITIEDLNGDNIETLTPNWGHKWGVGQADKDNGIVILLSKKDRKIWISPGYGTEVQLVAGITGEIVRNVIIPEFKAGSYYNGLDKGTEAIFKVLIGKYKAKPKEPKNEGSIFPILLVIAFVIIFLILVSKNKGNNGGNSGGFGGPDLMDIIILSRMGRGGGFGGGGFSGGGAGGSW